MKFSVFTASTPEWTPAEAATTLAAQGWDGIEWRIVDQRPADPPGFWAGNRATWPFTGLEDLVPEIARVTADAGLEFSGIGGYETAAEHERVLTILRATAALGARQARVTMPATGGSTPYPILFAQARTDLEWIAQQASALGVKALVETHQDTITPSASAALRLIDGLDPAAVGVIHDLGNLVVEGQENHRAAFEMLGPYLAHVHVKNARWVHSSGSSDWTYEWAGFTAGQASIPRYLKDLRAYGYDGWVTVEDFSTDVPLAERTAANIAYLDSLRTEMTT